MRFFLILLTLVALFSFCKNRSAASQATAPEVSVTSSGEPLPQDFLAFYEKFNTDSVFQMSSIQWPLPGEESVQPNDSSEMVRAPVQWHRETWALHRPLDLQDGAFSHEWQALGDALIIEKIREKTSGYFIERRWAKFGDEGWQLIYYADF